MQVDLELLRLANLKTLWCLDIASQPWHLRSGVQKWAHWITWRVGQVSFVSCGVAQDRISSIVLCSIMTYPLELLPYSEAFLLWVTTASLLACVDPHPPLLPPSAYLPLPNFLASSLFLSPTHPGRLAPEISISPLLDPLWMLVSSGGNDFGALPAVVSVPTASPLLWISDEALIKNIKVQHEF